MFFLKPFWEDACELGEPCWVPSAICWVNPGLLSPYFDRHARPRAGLGAREGAVDGRLDLLGTYGDFMGVTE